MRVLVLSVDGIAVVTGATTTADDEEEEGVTMGAATEDEDETAVVAGVELELLTGPGAGLLLPEAPTVKSTQDS